MTPEEKLAIFFAEAAPPARDLAFQAAVAERIARRRAIATVAALVPWTIAAIVLCWAVGPVVAPLFAAVGQVLAPAAFILVLMGLGVVVLTACARRLRLA